jgi:indolepyruvate ferredoxin oxidoreductase beta subunit
MKKSDVLIVGIGGQGTILASNILGVACVIEGKPVRGAETHGMAQRGGSVESHIRIGGEFGPLITPGTADLLIAFDLLEAVRYSHYLKPGGPLCANRQLSVPTSVFLQKLPVPEIEGLISSLRGVDICLVDADQLACEAGSPLTANVVMLGTAIRHLPLGEKSLLEAISRLVPKKTVEMNRMAFQIGKRASEEWWGKTNE